MSFHKIAPIAKNRKAAAPKPAPKKAAPKKAQPQRRPVGHQR